MRSNAHSGGFTFLELAAVIAIISILLAVALNRLLPYIDEAERVGVLTLESQIRSTLMTAAAKRIAGGRSASIAEFDGNNPMQLMLTPPSNYVGEFRGSEAAAVPRRKWFFNLDTRRLVYRRGRPFGSAEETRSDEDTEFAVRVVFEDRDGDGLFHPGVDELWGVNLDRVQGATWLAGGDAAR